MALQLTTVTEADFGQGIDSQSPPNQIPPGFIEDAVNADPLPSGPLANRRGYQGFAGNIPVRVQSIESISTTLRITLDSSINLLNTRSTPIILLGRSSNSTGGDITTTDSIHYYSTVNTDARKTFTAGSAQTLSIPATEHLLTTPEIWFGFTTSDSEVNSSNTIFYSSLISVDKSTFDATISYDNLTGSAFKGFVYFADRSNSVSLNYFGDDLGNQNTTTVLPSGGTTTYTITQLEHQLSSSQLLVKVFQDTGTAYQEIEPEAVVITKATGQVQVSLNNVSSGSINIIFSLSVAPTANFMTGAVSSGSTNTTVIDISGYADQTDFVFLAAYTDTGTLLTQVIPDIISIDSATQQMTVTFTDNGSGGGTFALYWQFVEVTTNVFTLTQGSSATYTDNRPQLTLYGLDHSEIYSNLPVGSHAGWTNHIDSYRSSGESRLISGLGGNIFAARFQTEGSNQTTYLMPSMYPSLQALVNVDTVLAPAFWDTGETPGRSRGFITADNGGSNYFNISSVTYDAGLGWVRIDLECPNLVINGTLSTIINTTGISDQLTIQGTSFRIHNSTFDIKQVTSGLDTISIWVENEDVDSADWNILGAGGLAAIFTDRLPLTITSPFITGDTIDSDLFSDSISIVTLDSTSSTVVLQGVDSRISLPAGLKIVGARTSDVIPLRISDGTASVLNLVRGDMLSYGEILRELRIKNINELGDIAVTIAAGDGTDALVTMGSGTTDSISIGERLLFRGGSTYAGVYTVSNIVGAVTFEISTTHTTSDTATMVGKTIQIDEELEWSDSPINANIFSVVARWIPIEAPDDSFNLTPTTYVEHFDTNEYAEQPILRSTMVKDSLYLANGDDEILKFDGTNIYRAGLFRWQPNLFLSVDSSSTGKIAINNPSVATTSHSQNAIKLTVAADGNVFRVGDILVYSVDSNKYTIIDLETVGSDAYIYVDRAITAGTAGGTLIRISRFKYYFRLNAIDANNNIIASAVVGSEDFVAELSVDAGVRIRLIGMPAWDIYDYDRLEVQIFRTKSNTVAPFYLITTLAMSFNNNTGYLDYVDTDADDDLINLDSVSTALVGAELGTGWSEPLRAKYITSAGNRLILGNIKDYPTLDIQLNRNTDQAPASSFYGLKWLFRKDNLDSGTTTDMVNRATYELRDVSTGLATTGVTASTTTFTITTAAPHSLAVKNWVYLYRTTVSAFEPKFSGWHQVSAVPTGSTFTVNFASDGITGATYANAYLVATNKNDIPVPIGTDGNYGMLNGNKTGTYEFLAMRRLGDAINTTMRKTDTTLSGQSPFVPWMIANAGNDFNSGQLIVKQPKQFSTTLEMVVPTFSSLIDCFVNSTKRVIGTEASAITKIFPSRLIISYPNFPEIFDAPTALNDIDSGSAIDVNSADGQEITAVIPFFGESAFGAALNSGVVVVFKTNSIYLVDLAAKASGTNPVQKIESQGKGCTSPYSVAVTRAGIMFVNETGIYRLNRSLGLDYIGRKYEGKFKNEVDTSYLDIGSGHHDAIRNVYKFSYVKDGETTPSNVAVYNHVREYEAQNGTDGSWTTYDNHPAIGWANLVDSSFFASTVGRVFITRQTNLPTDFRDDSSAITMTVITRANHFGDGGIRKFVKALITHYLGRNSSGTSLSVARDLVDQFEDTDPFDIRQNVPINNLGDTGNSKVTTILSTINSAKGVYFQAKYTNATKDEEVQIVGIDWRVSGLNDKGITQAAQTK